MSSAFRSSSSIVLLRLLRIWCDGGRRRHCGNFVFVSRNNEIDTERKADDEADYGDNPQESQDDAYERTDRFSDSCFATRLYDARDDEAGDRVSREHEHEEWQRNNDKEDSYGFSLHISDHNMIAETGNFT